MKTSNYKKKPKKKRKHQVIWSCLLPHIIFFFFILFLVQVFCYFLLATQLAAASLAVELQVIIFKQLILETILCTPSVHAVKFNQHNYTKQTWKVVSTPNQTNPNGPTNPMAVYLVLITATARLEPSRAETSRAEPSRWRQPLISQSACYIIIIPLS